MDSNSYLSMLVSYRCSGWMVLVGITDLISRGGAVLPVAHLSQLTCSTANTSATQQDVITPN